MNLPYVGMPGPNQMPPQQWALPPPDRVVEVWGVKVPEALLGSPTFWSFFLLVLAAMVAIAYFKRSRVK